MSHSPRAQVLTPKLGHIRLRTKTCEPNQYCDTLNHLLPLSTSYHNFNVKFHYIVKTALMSHSGMLYLCNPCFPFIYSIPGLNQHQRFNFQLHIIFSLADARALQLIVKHSSVLYTNSIINVQQCQQKILCQFMQRFRN